MANSNSPRAIEHNIVIGVRIPYSVSVEQHTFGSQLTGLKDRALQNACCTGFPGGLLPRNFKGQSTRVEKRCLSNGFGNDNLNDFELYTSRHLNILNFKHLKLVHSQIFSFKEKT